jgi:hypothetical protein
MNCRICKENKYKYVNLKLCFECSKNNLIIKTDSKKRFSLSDKDMENLKYDIKRTGLGRKCNLYYIKDVENYAIKKYGSKESYEKSVKTKLDRKKAKLKLKANKIEERTKELKKCLKKANLKFREDSILINQYINDSGELTISEIIDILTEMQFYYKNTDYSNILKKDRQKKKELMFGNEYWLYKEWSEDDEEELRDETKDKVLNDFIEKNKNNKDEMSKIPFVLLKKIDRFK